MIYPAHAIYAYCKMKGYPWETTPGHLNIVYIEGLNEDFTPNKDRPDEWNDLRIIVDHKAADEQGSPKPFIRFIQVATTEPGRKPTFSAASKKLGGVARLRFGHYAKKWVQGFHNFSRHGKRHPALIQKHPEVVMVHRDFNQDFKRTGDAISPAFGINHHGVLPGVVPKLIGGHSAGCPVGLDWEKHLEFIEITKTDLRYLENPNFSYSATIIAGDDFLKFRTNIG